MDTDDTALFAAWRAGDAAAGEQLADRHFAAVYSFFVGKVEGERAADLTQSVFLACLEAAATPTAIRSVRAWLLGIARNKLLRHLRDQGRHDDRFDPLVTSLAAVAADAPSQFAAEREEQRVLLHALRELPLDYQIALELAYWEQMTAAEIAEVLEVPAGTVRARLSRARDLLRERLAATPLSEAVRQTTAQHLDAWARAVRGLVDDELEP